MRLNTEELTLEKAARIIDNMARFSLKSGGKGNPKKEKISVVFSLEQIKTAVAIKLLLGGEIVDWAERRYVWRALGAEAAQIARTLSPLLVHKKDAAHALMAHRRLLGSQPGFHDRAQSRTKSPSAL